MRAKLRHSLYGTRAAPARCEALCTETFESFGFARGKASACCFLQCRAGCEVRRARGRLHLHRLRCSP
eukprot:5482649-Alexandrium_andersonii.AAC.1